MKVFFPNMHCKQHKLSRLTLCDLRANAEINIVYKKKCGKNKQVAHKPQASVSLMFLLHFDVFCDL